MPATASAYDAIDTEALNRRGILLTNTPIPVRHAVASIAVAFILTLSLRMPIKSRLAREGRWRERANYLGVGLPGRTLGIVGLGGIGRELVRLMQPYGMTILAADPHVGSAAAADVGVELCSLEELMNSLGLCRCRLSPQQGDAAFAESGSSRTDEADRLSHQCRARPDR